MIHIELKEYIYVIDVSTTRRRSRQRFDTNLQMQIILRNLRRFCVQNNINILMNTWMRNSVCAGFCD